MPSEDNRIQCFPSRRWREEFQLAALLGLDYIEWIYEKYGADSNPVASSIGAAELRALSQNTGVRVPALCADVLMDFPCIGPKAVSPEETVETVFRLMERAAEIGVQRIVLPFVAANAIRTVEDLDRAKELISRLAVRAQQFRLELHLETCLNPSDTIRMLDGLPASVVKINYDIGNSLIFDFQAPAELETYGDRIGNVHIKDAKRGKATVPLGQGDADFAYCFRKLREIGYDGPYTLQAARIPRNNDVDTVRGYIEFVRNSFRALVRQ